MSDTDGVWTGHLIHRWTRWMDMEVTTTVKRWLSAEPSSRIEHMERRRFRVCEICGMEQEGK